MMGLAENSSFMGLLLGAAFLAVPLAALFNWAAYTLPRTLDEHLPAQPSRTHRRLRISFWILAVVLAPVCVWFYEASFAALAAIVYIQALLTLAWIDAETGFLPDMLTLPLLWLGLLVNLTGTFTALPDAVVGAVAGYLMLWTVCQVFFLLTGRVGMGHGDLKLLAALGAWLGWMSLPWVLLVSSVLALTFVLLSRLTGRMEAGEAVRFGPWLAVAGIVALFNA